MRRPNLFIVGAPKCGTTSLHDYLSNHPQCFMSKIKEPGYFCRDDFREDVRLSKKILRDGNAYLDMFSGAGAHHIAIGESTTAYLRSHSALTELKAFSGDPKIIVLVRDPVDLVSSYYHYLRYQGWEPLETLREAWAIQDERCEGRIESRTAELLGSLAYRNVASLGSQVGALLDIFDAEKVLALTLDDLGNDTRRTLRRVESFLGLSHSHEADLISSNVARKARMQMLDDFVKRPHGSILWLKNRLKQTLGVTSLGISRSLDRFNSVPIRHDVDNDLVLEMRSFFRDDVALLGKLLGLDLFALWGWNVN